MSNDSILESPTNTDGFIDAQSGTVKTLLPPNSRSFILGPLVDGYNYNHGYDDYTTIGYIQKDTRQFVLLGQIDGHWDTNVTESGFTPRLWDGTTFTAYNPSFTLAMAQWFKDRITANDYTKNFPYFYSGGVAQSPLNNQPPGSPGGMIGGNAAGTGGGGKEPSDGDGKAAVGSGGTPDIGTETPQGDPEGGDAASQGYPAWGRSGSKNKRGSGARGNRGRKKPKPSTPKPQVEGQDLVDLVDQQVLKVVAVVDKEIQLIKEVVEQNQDLHHHQHQNQLVVIHQNLKVVAVVDKEIQLIKEVVEQDQLAIPQLIEV